MIRFLLVVLMTFILFIFILIVLTKKEEEIEKSILSQKNIVDGRLVKSVRSGTSFQKDNLKYIYKVTYQYVVNQKEYKVNAKIEVDSYCMSPLPEIVSVYYDMNQSKRALISFKESIDGISLKENVKSLFPSILISVSIGFVFLILFVF